MPDRFIRIMRSSALPYLSLMAVSMIGGPLLEYVCRSQTLFMGQSAGILFVLAISFVVLVAWLILAPRRRMQALPLSITTGVTALWLIATLRVVADNGAFNYTALVTPMFLLMLALKPPTFLEALQFGDIVAVGLSLSVVITQLLDLLDLRTNRADIVARWRTPFSGDDVPFRWEGMFTDPNYAGFIGAFLIVYGIFRRKLSLSAFLASCGVFVIFASESRSAVAASLVGVAIFLIIQGQRLSFKRPTSRWLFRLSAGALVLCPFAALIAMDPSLNGRGPIWSSFIRLSSENLLFGVGADRIMEASRESQIPWGNIDGHSIIVDPLARNGITAALIAFLVLMGVGALTFRARTRDLGLSLGVFATFLVGALTYTVTTWQYPTVHILPLLVSFLISGASPQGLSSQHSLLEKFKIVDAATQG